ncbi:MAG TPA: lytic transglycosylase domain-containing protein, partial [Terriglobales bacterium]|nr:lytic transglycosylase domain-containing protein [Terriglobales bacterium]
VDEVETYVDSRPAVVAERKPAKAQSINPNYRDLARGRVVSTAEIDNAIQQAAKRHGVDPNLVRAMIKVESNFNPRAVSRKGAMGLMQLMPDTARGLKVTNPFDPNQNVDAGVRYFKNLMNNYGGNVNLSLAAYNAGARNVAQAGGVPRFPETQNYVKQITNMYWHGDAVRSLHVDGTPSLVPAKMFRSAEGKLVITNTE